MASTSNNDENLINQISRLLTEKIDKKAVLDLAKSATKSVKVSRKGVTLSGKTLADVMFTLAPKVPVRDLAALQKSYGGMQGDSLAAQVIKQAKRNSAAVGGATGALASAGEFAPPFWVMLPVELVLETLLIAGIEMKMIGELHAVYGMPLEGEPQDRGHALLESWAQRRGVEIEELAGIGVKGALSQGARAQLTQVIRRKLMIRFARNISSLAPLFIGAAAGAELNRRATRDLGDDLAHDLSRRTTK